MTNRNPNPRMQALLRPALTLLAAAALGASLPACAPLIIGGAMVGGSMMALDRRTSGAQVEDQSIELKAASRVRDLATFGNVSVTSYNRLVLITGEVPTEGDRTRVEDAVKTIENVRSVVNELAVAPNNSLTDNSRDSVTSAKVKATLVDAKDMQSSAIKIITERGIVYLMGIVTEREANRAGEIAASVPGVQKVVRVFEVVSEAELAGTAPPQSSKP